MKVEQISKENVFKPITLNITLESAEELAAIAALSVMAANHGGNMFKNNKKTFVKILGQTEQVEVSADRLASFLDNMFPDDLFNEFIDYTV